MSRRSIGGAGSLIGGDYKTPAFLPLYVITEEVMESATRGIEIVLSNGRYLHVEPEFDPGTLVKTVNLLKARGVSC